jgi:MFS family permease
MQDTAEHGHEASGWTPVTAGARGRYMVVVFTLGLALAYLDRQLLSLVVAPIQASLRINDTQIGLLQGGMFSLFYVIGSIPLARMVDRGRRTNIMAVCIAAWSILTAACGLAVSFTQLLLARVGVAVGEAAVSPAAISMISDTFKAAHVPKMSSFFMMGPHLGSGLALIVGGTVYQALAPWDGMNLPVIGALERWQLLFIALGLPGVAFALVVKLTIREPARIEVRGAATHPAGAMPSARDIVKFASAAKGFHFTFFFAIAAMFMLLSALSSWTPTLLNRRYAMGISTVGFSYGQVVLLTGITGALFAGWFSARWKEISALAGCLRLLFRAALLSILPAAAAPLMPVAWLSMVLIGISLFLCSCVLSMGAVPIQLTAPNRMRGQLVALLSLIVSLTGAGVGPVLVGALTDYIFGTPQSLHLALSSVGLFSSAAATLLLYRARKSVSEGLLDSAARK